MRWFVGETPQTEVETRPGPRSQLHLQVLAAHVDPLIFTSLYLDPRFGEGVLAEGTGLQQDRAPLHRVGVHQGQAQRVSRNAVDEGGHVGG